MSIKKEYLTDKGVCKVKFSLPPHLTASTKKASLVGDFNNWDPKQAPMIRRRNGIHSVSIELRVGNEYQFKYLIDGTQWENESEADKKIRSEYQDSENSVIVV
ncbi:MAG: isoamylase early set domain-containing protein [Bacteroidota bacterium]